MWRSPFPQGTGSAWYRRPSYGERDEVYGVERACALVVRVSCACNGCTRRLRCGEPCWPRRWSGSNTCPTACLTLCSAWLTACLTPGEIAYASRIAAIPTAAMISARRARLDSLSGEAGRTLNGEMAMLNKTLASNATTHGGQPPAHGAYGVADAATPVRAGGAFARVMLEQGVRDGAVRALDLPVGEALLEPA
jgi:hypothetical protein